MQRMFNLSKWVLVPEGVALVFSNPKQRMVTLDVNCPDQVRLYVIEAAEDLEQDPERKSDLEAGRDPPPIVVDGAPKLPAGKGRAVTFLGLALGRDRFEFGVEGAFELLAIGGHCYVYTIDSQELATRIVAPVIFTKIANRRQRNPQLEMMEYQMRLNSNRMYAELANESERRINALERRLESYAPQRPQGTPLETGRRVQPAQSGGGASPNPSVGESDQDEAESRPGGTPAKGRKPPKADDDQGALV